MGEYLHKQIKHRKIKEDYYLKTLLFVRDRHVYSRKTISTLECTECSVRSTTAASPAGVAPEPELKVQAPLRLPVGQPPLSRDAWSDAEDQVSMIVDVVSSDILNRNEKAWLCKINLKEEHDEFLDWFGPSRE
jgi:hypothetical protein